MNTIGRWSRTVRLEKGVIAILAIALGSSLALHAGDPVRPIPFVLMLITAIGLQLMANVANDYGDLTRGVDTPELLTQSRGPRYPHPSRRTLLKHLKVLTLFTALSGSALLYVSGSITWACVGLLCIIASITYTVGPIPYGYYMLGDLAVFVFFGLVGVYGSFLLHTGKPCARAWWSACAFGSLITSQLTLNNLRDHARDRRFGKWTLANTLGPRKGLYYYGGLLLLSEFFWTKAAQGCHHIHLWPLTLFSLPLLGYKLKLSEQKRFTRSLQWIMLLVTLFILSLLCCGAGKTSGNSP